MKYTIYLVTFMFLHLTNALAFAPTASCSGVIGKRDATCECKVANENQAGCRKACLACFKINPNLSRGSSSFDYNFTKIAPSKDKNSLKTRPCPHACD